MTFSRNFALLFSKYFGEKYFERKAPSSAETSALLLNNGITQWRRFGELSAFFRNIFLQNVMNKSDLNRAIKESINFCFNQMHANTYFLLIYQQ